MKIKLLELGYCGTEGITFPVEVEAVVEKWCKRDLVCLTTEEILRIGGDPEMFIILETYPLVETEFEIVEDAG